MSINITYTDNLQSISRINVLKIYRINIKNWDTYNIFSVTAIKKGNSLFFQYMYASKRCKWNGKTVQTQIRLQSDPGLHCLLTPISPKHKDLLG